MTACPVRGQDATVAVGCTAAPHLSARLMPDCAHLADTVSRCRRARTTDMFVVGGDRTTSPPRSVLNHYDTPARSRLREWH